MTKEKRELPSSSSTIAATNVVESRVSPLQEPAKVMQPQFQRQQQLMNQQQVVDNTRSAIKPPSSCCSVQ